jgi:hypothetical protein
VTQYGLIGLAELQQLQRPTLVQMPHLVRRDLMPATKTTLREQKVDRRERSARTAAIHRSYLNSGPEYLSIKTALRVRTQIQSCDQLNGSRVITKNQYRIVETFLRTPVSQGTSSSSAFTNHFSAKHERAVFCIDFHGLAFTDFAFEDVDAERIENFFLNGAPQRARAVNRIVTFARQ